MAISSSRPGPGLIFHSDRGSQYTSRQFGDPLASNGVRQSLSRPRQCWDNARVEALNTKIRLITRRAFGFHSSDALIALATLSLGGIRPALPGRS